MSYWNKCDISKAEAMAIRAMHSNNATADQQRIFMLWLNTKASPVTSLAWSPVSERESSFEAGRRFIALKIIEVLGTNQSHYEDQNG